MAGLVTLASGIIAFPIAYYAARFAKGRWKAVFYLGIMLPLWSSYLVKVYAWRAMLQPESGVLAWFLNPLGLDGPGYGYLGIVITLTYLWLPYMILPIYAGFTQLPDSMLDAYIELKMQEVTRARVEVAPVEYDMYFSL